MVKPFFSKADFTKFSIETFFFSLTEKWTFDQIVYKCIFTEFFSFFTFSQLSAVLNFLCSVPGPSGEPALHFVMSEWVGRQHVFYGSYE